MGVIVGASYSGARSVVGPSKRLLVRSPRVPIVDLAIDELLSRKLRRWASFLD